MKKEKKLHIAFDPIYAHPLPEGHRFPMLKYELIPQQLIYEGTITEDALFSPGQCPDEIILLTHAEEYLYKLKHQSLSAQEQRRIGFPQSPELTKRELIITQGTIDCCHYAFENNVAMNVAGGTHHAFRDRGEGFCLLNDFAVAANYLLHKKLTGKVLIIDLDVHQGNGTAKLFEGNDAVFTFSMHGRNNYPFHKEKSDLDIELEDGTTTEEYITKLQEVLPLLIDNVQPDFAFYLSGVDILETDKFGKLKVTVEGCKERDRIVFCLLEQAKVPCVVSMGGGYSPQVKTIVEAHCNTFRLAKEIFDLY
ncbi:MAG TPA: histone deacetylase [Flavisolibacter sp.]|jgi:acetoin utilization deacetylase AcuC-like enzyme